MTRGDETLLAVAGILQGLAKDVPNSASLPFNGYKTNNPTNGDVAKIKLPGEDSDGKAILERELEDLIRRIGTMQSFVVCCLRIPPTTSCEKPLLFLYLSRSDL